MRKKIYIGVAFSMLVSVMFPVYSQAQEEPVAEVITAFDSPLLADESPENKTGIEFYDLLIFAKKFNEITLCLSVKYARLFSITL